MPGLRLMLFSVFSFHLDVINEGMMDNVSDVVDAGDIPDGASDGKCSEV